MAVEGLAGDAESGAQLADPGLALAHGGLGEAQLGRGHLVRPPPPAATRARGGQAGPGALADQLALELGQRREDAEHQPAGRRWWCRSPPPAGEDSQPHAALGELVDEIDEVAQVAPEPVELPGDQDVAWAQRLQACVQPGPAVALA